MPENKINTRLDLIRELSIELISITFSNKYQRLSYVDLMQVGNILMNDFMRWHRKGNGYRKLKND